MAGLSDDERDLILASMSRLDRVLEHGREVLARHEEHPRRPALEAALTSLEQVRSKAIDFLAAEDAQERQALHDALQLFVAGIADLSRLLVEDAGADREGSN